MKRLSVALLLAVLILASPALAIAGEAGMTSLGLRVGYWQYKGDEAAFGGQAELGADPAFGFGASASYFPINNFALVFDVDHVRTKLNINEMEVGDLHQTPILLSLRFQPTLGDYFMPYLGGGGGYYLNYFKHFYSQLQNTSVKDNFGWHLCFGADYLLDELLTPNTALSLDVRYAANRTEEENIPNPDPLTLDAWVISSGFKIYW
jgi:outer membrane protein W